MYNITKHNLLGRALGHNPPQLASTPFPPQPLFEPTFKHWNQLVQSRDPQPRMLMRLQIRILFIRQQHRRRARLMACCHIINRIADLPPSGTTSKQRSS